MAINFKIVHGSITGRRLIDAYRFNTGQVSEFNACGVVCYGTPYKGTLPALNAKAGTFDKLQELEILTAAGIRVPKFSRDGTGLRLPILGRLRHHTKGRDIIPILGPMELSWARRTRDFFTEYIPVAEEYRVWIFQTNNIGTYKKVFTYPQNYKQFGCNAENGFSFQHVDFQREVLDLGVAALKALRLDFGAIDILQSQIGQFYVLEVNTAPGTEQDVLNRLAKKILEWEQQGCRTRQEVVAARRCKICLKLNCLCAVRTTKQVYRCCGKRTCICERNVR